MKRSAFNTFLRNARRYLVISHEMRDGPTDVIVAKQGYMILLNGFEIACIMRYHPHQEDGENNEGGTHVIYGDGPSEIAGQQPYYDEYDFNPPVLPWQLVKVII